MSSHVWKHTSAFLVVLGLLIVLLLASFSAVQARQPGLLSSRVQPASTPTPTWTCTVIAPNGLNFREGPGMNYGIVGGLPRNRQTQPLAASPDRQWLQVVANVENPRTGLEEPRTGWVSSRTDFIRCNVQPSQLPIGEVPPTPTAPAVAPTPTPESIGYSPAPSVGGDPDGLVGNVWLLGGRPGVVVDGAAEYVFRDRLGIEMRVRDPSAGSGQNGRGIESVEFRIQGDDNDVYCHRDTSPPFCLFDCTSDLSFQRTNRWPSPDADCSFDGTRNEPFDPNTDYSAEISISSWDGRKDGNWNFDFRIIPANMARRAFYTLNSVNSDSDRDAEVQAQYDTVVSDTDLITRLRNPVSFRLAFDDFRAGDIGEVEFTIWDSDRGEVIHRKIESAAPYCVYGNGTDQPCTPLPLSRGRIYQAFMVARDSAGNEVGNWDFPFTVQ